MDLSAASHIQEADWLSKLVSFFVGNEFISLWKYFLSQSMFLKADLFTTSIVKIVEFRIKKEDEQKDLPKKFATLLQEH